MFRRFLILCILLSFSCKSNRLPYRDLTQEEWEEEAKNHKCAYIGKYTDTERQAMYPYNLASKVLLVSFDTLEADAYTHILPMLNSEVNLSALKENVALNKTGIDSLTDIIFNLGYSGKILLLENTGCYDPHNAILFTDDDGKIFEYMEICFGCDRIRVSSERLEFGEPCDGKYEAIREFFKSKDIKIGTSGEH
jgi:hypothetical protein